MKIHYHINSYILHTTFLYYIVCPPEVPDIGYVALAAIMLSLFLMKDIIAPIRSFKSIPGCWSKLWSIILLFETLFAALVAIMYAVGAVEAYDAIANCIGVLFIHDLDEKAYEAFEMIQGEEKEKEKEKKRCCSSLSCCCCCCGEKCKRFTKTTFLFFAMFSIMVFSLILAGIFRAAQIAQVKEVYGDEYWDNAFSGGTYDYFDGEYYDYSGSFGNDDTFNGGSDTSNYGGNGGGNYYDTNIDTYNDDTNYDDTYTQY